MPNVTLKEPRASAVEPASLAREFPGINPDSSQRGHAEGARTVHQITERDQPGAVCGGDRGRAVFWRVPDRKQGGEFINCQYL